MDGKRVSQQELLEQTNKNRGGKAGWIAAAAAAGLLIAAAAGLCAYAGSYQQVFPGVQLGEESLEGLSREELAERVSPDALLSGEVTVTANGLELGTYTQKELGAQVDTEELTDAAWHIGREEGALGWLKNGWAMLKGRLGGSTKVEAEVSAFDPAILRRTAQELAADFDRQSIDGSYQLSRDGLYATKPAAGQRLDQEGLVEELEYLEGDPGEVEAPWEELPALDLDLQALAQELNAEPSAARYDVETGKVVDGEVGVRLDPEAAAFALEAAVPGETVQLPAEVVYPKMTAQELEAVLFRDVLSTTTTTVSGTGARKGNVKLAGAAVNGLVLNDGDVFDYNQVVGKRTVERGYGEAATYVNGETVNTVGGGICQVSSTIYLATLLANLEIVERYNHRFYPGYINSKLTVTIVGTKTDDTYVKMTYDLLGTTKYETEYVETEELPWGEQRQKQNGYTGYEVVSYRNVYKGDGTLLSSNVEAKSNYKSRNQIILTGTAGRPVTPEMADFSQPTVGDAGIPVPPPMPDAGGEPAPPPAQEDPPQPAPAPEPDTDIPGWLLH